jgi:hypothetical protein
LSRVDGLIWLDSSLRLKAFGVEITIRDDPDSVFLAQNPMGTKTNKLNPNGSVQLTASTKTDRDLREDRDGRKSGRQETADTTHG